VLANVGLQSAAADAKPFSDFLDREQFGRRFVVHDLLQSTQPRAATAERLVRYKVRAKIGKICQFCRYEKLAKLLSVENVMSGRGHKIITLRRRTRLAVDDWPGPTPVARKNGAGPVAPVQKRTPVASAHQVRAALVAIYKEELLPPNVEEAFHLAAKRFQTEGKRAPRKIVREILKERKFDDQRLTAGHRKRR
jgi:hypothetical protein